MLKTLLKITIIHNLFTEQTWKKLYMYERQCMCVSLMYVSAYLFIISFLYTSS